MIQDDVVQSKKANKKDQLASSKKDQLAVINKRMHRKWHSAWEWLEQLFLKCVKPFHLWIKLEVSLNSYGRNMVPLVHYERFVSNHAHKKTFVRTEEFIADLKLRYKVLQLCYVSWIFAQRSNCVGHKKMENTECLLGKVELMPRKHGYL